MGMCDKCNQPVDPANDAVRLDAAFFGHPLVSMSVSRHLLRTKGCEGSPSRAQYLEGQPRDTRDYPYIEENEVRWRAAYAAIQSDSQEQA